MSGDPLQGTDPPEEIGSTEPLARAVYSRRHFKNREGEPAKVTLKAFEPEKDRSNPAERAREISVDRFNYLSLDAAFSLAEGRATRRKVNFYGWAVLTAEDAAKDGRYVISSPSIDELNPAHADIMLPPATTSDDEKRAKHLFDLAECAWWLEYER